MAKISNEVRIGITVIVAVVIAYFGFRFMQDAPAFNTSKVLYVKFDNVSNLSSGGPVTIIGIKVGSIGSMRYLQEEEKVQVTLNINQGINVPVGSIARIKTGNPLAASFIEIEKSDASELHKSGDFLRSSGEAGLLDLLAEQGQELAETALNTMKNVDTLLIGMKNTLNQESQDNISTTIKNVSESTGALNEILQQSQEDISNMIQKAQTILDNVEELSDANKENIGSIIENLEKTSAEFTTLSAELNKTSVTMNELLTKVNDGEGSIGKLFNDPALYNNLDSLTFNLNDLIKNINNDPKRYLKHLKLVDIF